jgi:putative acetyltransferase
VTGPFAIRPEEAGDHSGIRAVHRAAFGGPVEAGLDWLREAGEDLVLVRGHPAYYRRFGFSPEPLRALRTPWDGPHMQALALTPQGREAAGPVAYPPAFAALL